MSKQAENSYEYIYKQCRDRVYGYCYRLLNHRETAEDLTQETFVRLILAFEASRQTERSCTFALTVARNLCMDTFRQRKRQPVNPLDAAMLEQTGGDNADFDRVLWAQLGAQVLGPCLETLTEEEKICFLLYHVEEFTYEQIADALGLSMSQVRYRIHGKRDKDGTVIGHGALQKLEVCLRQRGISGNGE
jgi:RNA polymerase sigma factor (sigma-70 family)